MILGFEEVCKAYFDSERCKPIEIAVFMSQNTQNNAHFQTLSRVRRMWGIHNFVASSPWIEFSTTASKNTESLVRDASKLNRNLQVL